MDQATATIIAAVIALSGSVTAAVIIKWKSRSEPQHQVYEYRFSYPMVVVRAPWIHSNSLMARMVRSGCWIVTALSIFVGIGALMWSVAFIAGPALLGIPEIQHRNLIVAALLPTGMLALIVGHWIGRRIEIPSQPEDDDDD